MKSIAVLGATGSIGVSTLQVVQEFPERFRVAALTGGRNIDLLREQALCHRPDCVAVLTEPDAEALRRQLAGEDIEVLSGVEGLIHCATLASVDLVVAAIVGAAGLVPTMAAVCADKDIALANKETLVMAGGLIMKEVRRRRIRLLPVDSEHSAIFQALSGQRREDVKRLILTASGGPFRDLDQNALRKVTPAAALAHPNWAMGRKISIDSATLMNKGLEVIEAHWLFAMPASMIDVHIHPESIVHSMVEYIDGSVIAQMGIPNMKTPIACALSWPERLPLAQQPLDLCALSTLRFSRPDSIRFPCLQLAYTALAAGGTMPAVMNAANEVAVAAFLGHRLAFVDIARVIGRVMDLHQLQPVQTVEGVLQADRWGRQQAQELIDGGLL